MTKIEILGTGCAKCKRLFANAEQAVKDLKITADVIKVEDLDAIVERGCHADTGTFHQWRTGWQKGGSPVWKRS